eukprot:CAMPEP_0116551000 /NCGR_PEP_ID=MMETSP0397-20121206/5728_1 /TAXON_ID=216820 /ORGANISM="Cyclophora tenuis, Strain ECT3854" /LENGTH=322 /DNA_ID=CAMNT_0004075871 /DNA_START=95 /DNA_END=1063 /DNA_ORIENTATION=+
MATWDDGSSLLGLGFSHSQRQDPPHKQKKQPIGETSADELMKHHLQQCLDYHQEMVSITSSGASTDTPRFVSETRGQQETTEKPHSQNEFADSRSAKNETPQNTADLVEEKAFDVQVPEDAIIKAKAIVQKFLLQTKNRDDMTPEECRSRRLHWFQKEQERYQKALLKNLEYVARKEERRLQHQLAQIQQAKQIETDMEKQHTFALEKRKQMFSNMTKAGIGSTKRQKLEDHKRRKGHSGQDSHAHETAAVYLSSLPRSIEEGTIRAMFESYGTIRNVRFYRHKETQELKGDGLLVYQIRKGASKSDLMELVCMQVSVWWRK